MALKIIADAYWAFGSDISKLKSRIDIMSALGADVYHTEIKPEYIKQTKANAVDYIQEAITYAHSKGMKFFFQISWYKWAAGENRDTFYVTPTAQANFLADFEWLVNRYKTVDGIGLEEPHFYTLKQDGGAAYRAFWNPIHVKLHNIVAKFHNLSDPYVFEWNFNSGNNDINNVRNSGIDVDYLKANSLYNAFVIQNGGATNQTVLKFTSIISSWKAIFPNWKLSNFVYITGSGLIKSPECNSSWVVPACYNQGFFDQLKYSLSINMDSLVFNSGFIDKSASLWPNDKTPGLTVADKIKSIYGVNTPLYGLSVSSSPPGAFITLTNDAGGLGNYGKTNRDGSDADHPLITSPAPGIYTLKLNLPGYNEISEKVTFGTGLTIKSYTLVPANKGYVLKFRDDFNSLSGWDIIWNNPSVFKVANSILTIDIPAGSTTPAWMRKTGFTWKYGKLSFRAKFPNATGSHAGVWAYKNNGGPCSNNPAWQSQDSVNIETNISKDTYGPRIAGHLTTNYSIWSDAICNQYMLQDTPYDGNNFHEYEIEWTPVAVVFKKDGVEMKRFTAGIPTQALDLNAGIDCVGNTGSACAGIQWMDKTPSYPMKMEIDWIQLEQLEEAGEQLIFEDHFNDAVLTGWQYIKSQSKVSVANSMLTMRGDSAADSPWIMKINPDGTPFTWKYGKLQVRMKVPSASNTRTGFWSYRNNRVQCANNPAILAQDSINLEITKSASSYTDSHGTRVAGHITTAWSTWTTQRCNQYDLWDTPNESLAFHDYEVEWTPSAVIFRKDGVEIKRITDPAMIPSNPINLNIAMAFGVGTGITWMDTTPPVYPVFFQVDSVRLYAAEGATPTTGSIDIQSNPTGAEVYFDNFLKGITPLILDNITPGTHVVEIRKTGYNNLEQSVVIIAGQTLTKMYTLQYSCIPNWQCEIINGLKTGYEVDGCGNRRENIECIPKGMLYISTIPVSGAKIYLDNEDTLSFTPAILQVATGIPHTIRVFVPGYKEFIESNIIVSDNQTISKIYTLSSSSRDSAGTVITVSTGLVIGTTLYGISKLLQR